MPSEKSKIGMGKQQSVAEVVPVLRGASGHFPKGMRTKTQVGKEASSAYTRQRRYQTLRFPGIAMPSLFMKTEARMAGAKRE